MKLLVVFGILAVGINGQDPNPVVNTHFGPVEGFNYEAPNGFKTQVFLGIPYAAPPVGNLRFEKSIDPTPWTTPVLAKNFSAACASRPPFNAGGSEDCLYLNIIRPTAPPPSPKGYPIIFWIHGGGYYIGSSKDKPYTEIAERLPTKGVIYMSVNYRQGGFGFLSTGANSSLPGNYGMWDIVQALKFVKKVAAQFGGDRDAVTIYGQSAGGSIASWLSLSPVTHGLFKQVIESSGTVVYNRGIMPGVITQSNNLISQLNCTGFTDNKACLKSKTTAEIQDAWVAANAGFVPVYDGELVPTVKVEQLVLTAKRRPIFMGGNSMEFNVWALTGANGIPAMTPAQAANFSRQDFENFVSSFIATPALFGNKSTAAAQEFVNYYQTQTNYPSDKNLWLQIYTQLISDYMFNIPLIREAKLRALAGFPVYVYLYNYVPDVYVNAYQYYQLVVGAGHSSEQWNVFGNAGGRPNVTLVGDAGAVQSTFTNLWTNFAKTGKAKSGNLQTPRMWTPFQMPYFEIKPNSAIGGNLWADRIAFWNRIALKYGYDWAEGRKVNKLDFFDDVYL